MKNRRLEFIIKAIRKIDSSFNREIDKERDRMLREVLEDIESYLGADILPYLDKNKSVIKEYFKIKELLRN